VAPVQGSGEEMGDGEQRAMKDRGRESVPGKGSVGRDGVQMSRHPGTRRPLVRGAALGWAATLEAGRQQPSWDGRRHRGRRRWRGAAAAMLGTCGGAVGRLLG
jgi:hypothetical protein